MPCAESIQYNPIDPHGGDYGCLSTLSVGFSIKFTLSVYVVLSFVSLRFVFASNFCEINSWASVRADFRDVVLRLGPVSVSLCIGNVHIRPVFRRVKQHVATISHDSHLRGVDKSAAKISIPSVSSVFGDFTIKVARRG